MVISKLYTKTSTPTKISVGGICINLFMLMCVIILETKNKESLNSHINFECITNAHKKNDIYRTMYLTCTPRKINNLHYSIKEKYLKYKSNTNETSFSSNINNTLS